MSQQLTRLRATSHERPWGTINTEPWWPNPDRQPIGEVWFEASAPILVKFLFTSANLSVQVHPADDYALKHHDSPGKTEMWHVLRAETGAQVALGLKTALSEEELRDACLSGKIVDFLNWIPAEPGDTFFTPAGTIHAIGGGVTICEVQQVSNITYRLYDWGRAGRELHLDHGVKVSHRHPHNVAQPEELLVECPYFRTESLEVTGHRTWPATRRETIFVALEGSGTIAGIAFVTGEAWEARAGSDAFDIVAENAVFLVTAVPIPE